MTGTHVWSDYDELIDLSRFSLLAFDISRNRSGLRFNLRLNPSFGCRVRSFADFVHWQRRRPGGRLLCTREVMKISFFSFPLLSICLRRLTLLGWEHATPSQHPIPPYSLNLLETSSTENVWLISHPVWEYYTFLIDTTMPRQFSGACKRSGRYVPPLCLFRFLTDGIAR